jgi:predicted DNA-binding transcriptional regulator AlpA
MSFSDNELMLNTAAAARFTGLSAATLAKLRCMGGGPSFYKLGSRCRYRTSDLTEWLNARRVANTSEASLRLPRRLTKPLSIEANRGEREPVELSDEKSS